MDPPECEVPAHLQRIVLLPGGGQRLALGLLAGVVLHIVHVPHLGQGPGNMYCMSTIIIHHYVYYSSSYLYSSTLFYYSIHNFICALCSARPEHQLLTFGPRPPTWQKRQDGLRTCQKVSLLHTGL